MESRWSFRCGFLVFCRMSVKCLMTAVEEITEDRAAETEVMSGVDSQLVGASGDRVEGYVDGAVRVDGQYFVVGYGFFALA